MRLFSERKNERKNEKKTVKIAAASGALPRTLFGLRRLGDPPQTSLGVIIPAYCYSTLMSAFLELNAFYYS